MKEKQQLRSKLRLSGKNYNKHGKSFEFDKKF